MLKLTETVDPKKALTLLTMSKNDMKQTFFNPDELFGDTNWTTYLNNIKRYLKKASSSGGTIESVYNYAKNQSDGRLYVANGCGLQMLQNKILRYVAGDYYYDADIQNCHPCIILHICDKFNIPTVFLKQYVTNRQEVLKANKLTKFDILVAINRDSNKTKRGNQWYNSFISEMEITKEEILKHIPAMVTDNTQNPISSKVNHYVLTFENKIVQQAIEFFNIKNVGVLMFDGLMINKDYCDASEMNNRLAELNETLKDEYGGLITFTQKPMVCDINLAESGFEIEEYDTVKKRFEEKHFLTLNPYAYYKQTMNSEGHWHYNQIQLTDFKNVCEEYRIIEFDEKTGNLKNVSIFNRWTQDPNKRQYQCTDFLPFTKEDISPDHVFNTFTGYQIDTEKGVYEEKCTANFDKLLLNLSNENQAMKDWLWKYTCHIIQKPTVLSMCCVVFKGLEGGGKDSYFQALENLIGCHHYSTIDNLDTMFGQFNSILEDKIILSINEMTGKNGIEYQERIKQTVTNPKNLINAKFQKPQTQTNCTHLFVNSNHDTPVNISATDRRFVVLKTGNGLVVKTTNQKKSQENAEFWTQYYADIIDINWKKSLYARLMNEDISEFKPARDAPRTSELDLMKGKNIQPIDRYMKELIDNRTFGQFLKKPIKGSDKHIIKFKVFSDMFKTWLVDNVSSEYVPTDDQIRQKLKNMNDGFEASRPIRFTTGGVSKVEKFSVFDMDTIIEYLDSYIFNGVEEECLDIGEVTFPKQPTKVNYAGLLDSR